MIRIIVGFLCLMISVNVLGSNVSGEPSYDRAFNILEGFRSVVPDVVINNEAKKCNVDDNSLLRRVILMLTKTGMSVENDGGKTDGILLVHIQTEKSLEGYCMSDVRVMLGAMAYSQLVMKTTVKLSIISLFDENQIVFTKTKKHRERVDLVVNKFLVKLIQKWEFFNKLETKNSTK